MYEGTTMNTKAILKEMELAEKRGDYELVKLIKSQVKDMYGDVGTIKTYGGKKGLIYTHVGK